MNHDRRTMDVAWRFAPGPAARFAAPEVEGAERVDTGFLQRYAAGRLEGEPYSPERLERARRERDGARPLRFGAGPGRRPARRDGPAADDLHRHRARAPRHRRQRRLRNQLRPHRCASTGSTATCSAGPSGCGWRRRSRGSAPAAPIGEMTYRAGATYRDPGLFGRDLTLVVSLFALRERLEAYDRDAVTGSVLLERRLSERLTVFAGPTARFRPHRPAGRRTCSPYQIAGVTVRRPLRRHRQPARPVAGAGGRTAPSRPSYSFATSAPFAPLRVTAQHLLGRARRPPQHPRRARHARLAARAPNWPTCRGTCASTPAAAARCAATTTSRSARATSATGPLAAAACWKPASNGASGSGATSAPSPSSMPARSAPAPRRSSPTCASAPASACATTPPIGPMRADVAVPLVKQQGSSGFGLYVGIGQAF